MQIPAFLAHYFCTNKKFLIYNMVSRNLKIKYRRSYLGIFWTVLAPISTAFIYFLVFQVIMKVKQEHYLVVVFSGILAWNFFVQCLSESVSLYVDSTSLLTKVPIPIHLFNLVNLMVNSVTFIVSIFVVLGVTLISMGTLSKQLLLLPYFMMCLGLINYAFSILFSSLFVFFRDLRQVIAIFLQLMFYGTPILYSKSMVPDQWRWILNLNPMGHLIPGIKACFTGVVENTFAENLSPLLWVIALNVFAFSIVKSARNHIVENL